MVNTYWQVMGEAAGYTDVCYMIEELLHCRLQIADFRYQAAPRYQSWVGNGVALHVCVQISWWNVSIVSRGAKQGAHMFADHATTAEPIGHLQSNVLPQRCHDTSRIGQQELLHRDCYNMQRCLGDHLHESNTHVTLLPSSYTFTLNCAARDLNTLTLVAA